jgi:hypothetical protein
MGNNPQFSDATTETAVNAAAALVNSGNISIYTGTQPVNANTALSGNTLLASCALGSPAFASATASGGTVTATANTISSDTSAAATGTATWFRVYKSDGVTGAFDGEVGTSASDLNLNTVSIVAGATVSVTSFTIVQGE